MGTALPAHNSRRRYFPAGRPQSTGLRRPSCGAAALGYGSSRGLAAAVTPFQAVLSVADNPALMESLRAATNGRLHYRLAGEVQDVRARFLEVAGYLF